MSVNHSLVTVIARPNQSLLQRLSCAIPRAEPECEDPECSGSEPAEPVSNRPVQHENTQIILRFRIMDDTEATMDLVISDPEVDLGDVCMVVRGFIVGSNEDPKALDYGYIYVGRDTGQGELFIEPRC